MCSKRLLILLMIGLGILVNVGCGPTQPAASLPLVEPTTVATGAVPEQAATAVIALVMKTLTNPFFIEMERGARQAEAELGIRLIVRTAAQETSIDQQIAIIEGLIEDKVDAIVIAPGDSTSLVPVLKRAQDAGIVIVNIDNRLDRERAAELGLTDIPFISVDNEQGAYLAVQYLSQALSGPAEVLVIEGIPTAQNAIDRTAGALRAFNERAETRVVAVETAHWKIDEAYEVTRKLLKEYPGVGAIFCANDMMALGAIQYLSEVGRNDVLVAGFDAISEGRTAINAGQLLVSVDQRAAQQGYLGINYAARLLDGQTVPEETMVDVDLITSATSPAP